MANIPIDVALATSTARGMRALVFTTKDIGYAFFIDGDADFKYSKTSDAGASWGAPVAIGAADTDLAFDVWFDQWTPGDTGTKIHCVWFGTTADDVNYRALDTNGDTLGTQTVVFAGATAVAGVGVFCTITKADDGKLFVAYDIDAGAERGFHRSTDSGATWSGNLNSTFIEATTDWAQLFPAVNTGQSGDVVAIYFDASANSLTAKYWDNTAGGPTESAAIAAVTESTTDLSGQYPFAASIRHSDGKIIVAVVTERDTATADHRVFEIDVLALADITITELTAIATNIDDHYHTAVFIDQNTDDIYVAYNGKRDGSEVLDTTTKVYYTKSTDGGTTWSAGDTAYMEGATEAVKQTWSPLMGNRFGVSWRVSSSISFNSVNSLDLTPAVSDVLMAQAAL